MATVLTLGSVPPANPYRQPASHRLAALATTAPESRREDRRRIDRHHRELKSGPPPPPGPAGPRPPRPRHAPGVGAWPDSAPPFSPPAAIRSHTPPPPAASA